MEVKDPHGTLWKRVRDNSGITANISFLNKTCSDIHGCMCALTEFLMDALFAYSCFAVSS